MKCLILDSNTSIKCNFITSKTKGKATENFVLLRANLLRENYTLSGRKLLYMHYLNSAHNLRNRSTGSRSGALLGRKISSTA